MSQKFNAKNLSYDTSLPPFLAALRSQNPESFSSPNPLLASNRRRGAKRSGSAEAEDAPLVVDAGGNVLDATVEGDGTVRYEGGDDGAAGAEGEEGEGQGGEKAAVKIGRKRKARVVGAGQEEEEEEPSRRKGGREESRKSGAGESGPGKKSSDVKPASKTKKKAKKIKLSFDDEGI